MYDTRGVSLQIQPSISGPEISCPWRVCRIEVVQILLEYEGVVESSLSLLTVSN